MIQHYFSVPLRRIIDPHDQEPDRVLVGGPVTCTAFTVNYADPVWDTTTQGWVVRIGLEIENVNPLYREAARANVQSTFRADYLNLKGAAPIFDVVFYSEAFPRVIPELRAEPPQDG